MTEEADGEAERRAVADTFDRIAEEFADTRENPWPDVVEFVDQFADDVSTGVDIGCGNGRHAELLTERAARVVGVDISPALLGLARERWGEESGRFHPVIGDAVHLPLHDDTADIGIYIATIHHLAVRSARRRSLDELDRVLKPDRPAIVSAWSTVADRFDREQGFDTTIGWRLDEGGTVDRFYHIYDPTEFEKDLRASSLAVEKRFLAEGNCYAIVRGSR